MAAAAVVGVGSVIGGELQSSAAKSGAKKEANAAQSAADLQHQAFEQSAGYLNPYITAGQSNLQSAQSYMSSNPLLNGSQSFNAGSAGLPYANSQGAFDFNGSDLANTPGYQFQLQQGENAVNNAQAASGLAVSGAQQKAMANYVTGLADTTYNQQFQNQLNAYNSSYANALNSFNTNYGVAANQYNRYSGLAQQGLGAGEALASAAQGTAGQAGQAQMAAGQASAAGQVGSANALSGALNGASGAYLAANLLSNNNSQAASGSSGTYNPLGQSYLTNQNPLAAYNISPTAG